MAVAVNIFSFSEMTSTYLFQTFCSVNNPFPETRRSRLTVEPSHFIRPPYFIDHSEPPYLEKKKPEGKRRFLHSRKKLRGRTSLEKKRRVGRKMNEDTNEEVIFFRHRDSGTRLTFQNLLPTPVLVLPLGYSKG